MAERKLSELETAARFEPDAAAFSQLLAKAEPYDALDTLHALVTANDLDKGPPSVDNLAQRVSELFNYVAIPLPEEAPLELLSAASQARPDIFRALYAQVTDPKMREDALEEAKAPPGNARKDYTEANLAQMLGKEGFDIEAAFKSMQAAIKEHDQEKLEQFAAQYPQVLNRTEEGEHGENALLMAVLKATRSPSHRQSGFLIDPRHENKMSVEDASGFIMSLLEAGAVPVNETSKGLVYGMEKKRFLPYVVAKAEAALMENMPRSGPRVRQRYEDDHPSRLQPKDAWGKEEERRAPRPVTTAEPEQALSTENPSSPASPKPWSEGRRGNPRNGGPDGHHF